MSNCLKHFDIERYFAGELDKSSASALEMHFETCSVCFSYLQDLRREKNEFLAEHPFSSFYTAKVKETGPAWYTVFTNALARPVLVPVLGLLLVITAIPVVNKIAFSSKTEDIIFKGNARLSFIYEREGIVSDGRLTDTFREGDRIQVIYNSSREWFVSLLSIDTRGRISFYHPDQNSVSCSVPSGKGSGLHFPGSIILDNSDGGELIVAVFSPQPLKTESVEKSISEIVNKHRDLEEIESAVQKFSFSKGSQTSTLLLRKE